MSYTPPPSSAVLVQGIPFESAKDIAQSCKRLFDAADQGPHNRDLSRCKALLLLPDGTVFWSSKMAIDADGPAADSGRLSGSRLDPPDGQDDTSYHYPDNGLGLAAEVVPYIVLPGGTFGKDTGLELGDMAVVIFGDKMAAAVAGDIGPVKKIGEGSIRLHELLHPPAPDPCISRDANNNCQKVRNASIGEDVLFFVFPGSAFASGLDQSNVESEVSMRAMNLFIKLSGSRPAT
jgi:hypothetical protein